MRLAGRSDRAASIASSTAGPGSSRSGKGGTVSVDGSTSFGTSSPIGSEATATSSSQSVRSCDSDSGPTAGMKANQVCGASAA